MLSLELLELKNKVIFLNAIKQEMNETADMTEKQNLSDFYMKKSSEMNDYIERFLKKEKENSIYKKDVKI